jgi:transcriptional regulator with XRE-family HTH domain
MTDDKRRPRPAAQYGPTAEAVAQNVRRLRERRGMTIYSLSGALRDAGRPITPSAIAKIEKQQRQVTVDDLTALATVLDVSPAALLLPPAEDADQPVQLTPSKSVPWQAAWRWAHGEQPAFTPGGDDDPRGDRDWAERRRRFLQENQPYRDADHLREIARYIAARIDGPWHLELDSTSADERGALVMPMREPPLPPEA